MQENLPKINKDNTGGYSMTLAICLKPFGTLLKILRNINNNVYIQSKHVSRHARVSTPNINQSREQTDYQNVDSDLFKVG